jgi:acyl dehydratase
LRLILALGLQLQYFEDLPLGAEWVTRRRTIAEADLVAFSALAGDYNPLHVDAEYARTTEFGALVAPAGLVSSTAIGLGSIDVPLPATVGMVGMSWKFLRPLKIGDTIHARWRLVRKRAVENPRWGLAVWRVEVLDQRSEICADGEITRLVARAEPQKQQVASSRRRRRRRSGGTADQPVPESAPADTPPPSRRARHVADTETVQGAETARTGAPRRRRRRRPSNGSAPPAVQPEPATAIAPPQPESEPVGAGATAEQSPVGRMFRRFRTRRPGAPEG